MKRIIIDLDHTLTLGDTKDYANVAPNLEVIRALRSYKAMGFEVVIHTARNMNSYQSNVGKITAKTVPIILDWLTKHDVPFDEISVGKPWCGTEGFYVDDRSIRPDEFVSLSLEEIQGLMPK